MATTSIEERLAAVEAELADIKARLAKEAGEPEPPRPWWEQIRGTFKDDPIYDEAMRLGREWRDSQSIPELECE